MLSKYFNLEHKNNSSIKNTFRSCLRNRDRNNNQNLSPSVLAMRCLAVSIPFFDFLIDDRDGDANFEAIFVGGFTPGRIDDGVSDNNEDAPAGEFITGEAETSEREFCKAGRGKVCCCCDVFFGDAEVFFFGADLLVLRRSAATLRPISMAATFFALSRVGLGSDFLRTFLTRTFGFHASSLAAATLGPMSISSSDRSRDG